MATKLVKPIHREMLSVMETRGRNRGRSTIVSLLPGDEIQFRSKGTRKTYTVYLGHCFVMAQIQTILLDYDQALERYNTRRKAGERARRPIKPILPFSNMYLKAFTKPKK